MNSDKEDSFSQQLEYFPEPIRTTIAEWIKQGRSDEAIHGVLNFFSGKGRTLLDQEANKRVWAVVSGIKEAFDQTVETDNFHYITAEIHKAIATYKQEGK